jgi:hypothetical protein
VTPPLSAFATLVLVFELGCVAAGLVVLWRHGLSPAARAAPPQLRAWDAPWPEFLTFAASILLGTFFLAALAGLVVCNSIARSDECARCARGGWG